MTAAQSPMPTRRACLALPAALALAGAPARAATAPASFIRETGAALVHVLNGPDPEAAKRAALQQIIDSRVDVDGIARFCLGRFWHGATPSQRQEYEALFRRVLVLNVTAKVGAYKGVSFTIGRVVRRAEGTLVATTVTRPGQPPAEVDWLVKPVDGHDRIIDVVAEGTSLRVTQRSDYASYITRHGGDVAALITALRHQVGEAG
ncbi:MAG: MlaC/ttg2D family ABC transporter substrate-binding protein [Acetobacteraceae bacterium]